MFGAGREGCWDRESVRATSLGSYVAMTIGVVISLLLGVALFAANAMKGKFLLALLAFVPVLGWFAVAGAIRLARPGSWWSRRFYEEEKLQAAEDRFRPLEERERGPLGMSLAFECGQCGELFEGRDLALHHIRQYHDGIFNSPEDGVIDKRAPGQSAPTGT